MQNAISSVSDVGVKVLILVAILSLFPESPFIHYVSMVDSIPFLRYLNWFVPIGDMLAICEAWLAVVSVYYTYLFGARFTGIVKG